MNKFTHPTHVRCPMCLAAFRMRAIHATEVDMAIKIYCICCGNWLKVHAGPNDAGGITLVSPEAQVPDAMED